jgi:hypothetical protein
MRVREGAGALALATPFLLAMLGPPALPDAHVAFRFSDREIVESSGLTLVDGLFATVNDSGDTGRVFMVDPISGDTVGLTSWSGEPTDVEAVAPGGSGTVWVGDLGDNRAHRSSVRIAEVPVGRGARRTEPAWRDLTYPGGARDAEALLADPRTGRLFLVSKQVLGGTVYAVPSDSDQVRAVGSVLGLVTDGAFLPDGEHVILRNYTRAAVYSYPGFEEIGSFELPAQEQGEGLAVGADGSIFLSSEGTRQPVLRVRLPRSIRTAMTPSPRGATSSTGSPPPRPPSAATDQGQRERAEPAAEDGRLCRRR